MSRPTPISGFPEWLPPQRMVEQYVVDHIRDAFERHGFAPVETRAVEPLDQLLRKGETSKEVYVLRRLQADPDDGSDDSLGLHFDLTVPFARYTLENAGRLAFPFRRYQIQKVWRGERPQLGRYREFLQADVDVVDRDKLGPARVSALLAETAGATEAQIKATLALAEISAEDASFADAVAALGVRDPLLDEGLAELVRVIEAAREHAPGLLVADLKIARGLDYYTGTVYEVQLRGYERFGTVAAGGRYDNLASSGTERYPGVGISLGISRMLGPQFDSGALTVSRQVPTCVVVAVPSEAQRPASDRIAAALRRRGIPTEVSPSAAKYGKQIRYAERRGIPYVWFPGDPDEVKDIRSGAQVPAEAATWNPPPADLRPVISRGEGS